MNLTPRSDAARRSSRKNPGDAWLSPPSACTGSTINPTTSGSASISARAASRQRRSSALFASTLSADGYFSFGKGATGQSYAGTSSLCMGLLCVTDRQPCVRPWKAPWKDMILYGFAPGARLTIDDSSSSGVGPARPSAARLAFATAMYTCFMAFSLAHDPHIWVVTCVNPGGATRISVDWIRSAQPAGGRLKSAGLCASQVRLAGSRNTSSIRGLLYPIGRDAMCENMSSMRLPSTSTT
mmetsp:Transcript_6379/g.28084  ORF Transcript_6379/g.28084 Transcript_6379/m.28084 type:complete len:240 (+) Transcript_6379:596-1315(+)